VKKLARPENYLLLIVYFSVLIMCLLSLMPFVQERISPMVKIAKSNDIRNTELIIRKNVIDNVEVFRE
jgi:hypothetical protein